MSSLWKVESINAEGGQWAMFVRCESPFDALRLASERKPWSVLDGISVKGVLDFIDADAVPNPETPTTTD